MVRSAFSHLELDVSSPAQLILSVAVAGSGHHETLTVIQNGSPLEVSEVTDQHGTRLHLVKAEAGRVVVDYTVQVDAALATAEIDELDELRYIRPSRYCESDTLGPTARNQFRGLTGRDLLAAVSSWVGSQLFYVPGSSAPTDGAVATMLARQGVCRDYAHLVVALLRALDVPARLVSVYAPGLYPMDFHAVAEAFVDGDWHVVDATTLAPRQSLMRIATGRDASDTAFLSTRGGAVSIHKMEVGAVVDELPRDDVNLMVKLA
ncbi:transglutaminase-like putative cysteine protease [Glaciihabitans tibetensis]|uniref:Transglutaminase-like putative cysteine protease n=1 Tax=Glaciihabitans tibetensis TaxID=1266600 RepID=A0A2T0VE01_9MICO|nr:transglutaminase family protein [Glaciihabitans tibetensis]PRY68395.1 transglutaminase-like putative cysteine protease [Glaciihabitans tibetensis]